MRYFFNLIGPHGSQLDRDGLEISVPDNLRIQIVKAIQDLRQENPSTARNWDGWRLEVIDASGVITVTIDLDDFLPETPDRLVRNADD